MNQGYSTLKYLNALDEKHAVTLYCLQYTKSDPIFH